MSRNKLSPESQGSPVNRASLAPAHPSKDSDARDDAVNTFDELGLAPPLAATVAALGYEAPTPIQQRAIPLILDGKDLLAAAQTGTGKTAAFVLPMLQRLAYIGHARPGQVRALVLVPTRELALQVHEAAEAYASRLELRTAVVFGGVKIGPQIDRLRKGIDLLIATPGRLLDLAGQKVVSFPALEVLVLDEADRMLDMGFIHDLKRIVRLLPRNRQTLMFSATFSREIKALAKQYLVDPASVQISPPNSTTDLVQQVAYPVPKEHKASLLVHLLRTQQWPQVLVFTRTKHGANRLAKRLVKEGFNAAPIHGNKSQNARQRALKEFRNGQLQALVATDIAARGLDIDQLPEVVNFDLPAVPEDYVHRIGRTGRAGSAGRSHSIVSPEDIALLRAIEKCIGQKIPRASLDDFEAPAPEQEPVSRRAAGDAGSDRTKPRRHGRAAAKSNAASKGSGEVDSQGRGSTQSAQAERNGDDKPRRRRRRRRPGGTVKAGAKVAPRGGHGGNKGSRSTSLPA